MGIDVSADRGNQLCAGNGFTNIVASKFSLLATSLPESNPPYGMVGNSSLVRLRLPDTFLAKTPRIEIVLFYLFCTTLCNTRSIFCKQFFFLM
jgi:hypothetical protein